MWSVVVPVKHSLWAKSRLKSAGDARPFLARAFALDTLESAAACELVREVIVVSDDEILISLLPLGIRVVSDPGAGLNAAIGRGIAASTSPARAALLGDLPALDPIDLCDALRAASAVERAVVADAEETGSTLVTAAPGVRWASAFGAGSLAAHRALGCVELALPRDSSLRRDVDTFDQLDTATSLGLGPRSSLLLDRRGVSREQPPALPLREPSP